MMDTESLVLDNLNTIRPFTEGQLLALHSVDVIDKNDAFVDSFLQDCINCQDCEFYGKLGELKKWKFLMEKTRYSIQETNSSCDCLQDSVWSLTRKCLQEKARCLDGRLVEVKHSFNESSLRPEQIKIMHQNFLSLQDLIPSQFASHYFMSQFSEKQVQVLIKAVIDLPTMDESNSTKVQSLKQLISCIFAFIRSEDHKTENFKSCSQWLTQLINILFRESNDMNDRLFLLNHILRCSGGISKWAVGFIQCPSPLETSDLDIAIENMNYCLLMLHTILSPVKGRDKFLGILPSPAKTKSKEASQRSSTPSPEPATVASDDAWLLLDSETDQSEEVFANSINFTENDIISLLKQIPFLGVIEFVTKGSSRLDPHFDCAFGEVSEVAMLKLLAVATRIIKILRQGLITFNCIQFKALTEYITLLIKTTVKGVASFWNHCQENIQSDDQALLLRLQVEYDHFILRTTTTILQCQRFGSWKFMSVIPFKGVTEAMMWHILWVFYNNGQDDEGLSSYASDWKAKFDEPSVKLLLRDKLASLSTSECHSLLESLANMVKSRDCNERDFTTRVTNEMLELSFMIPQKSDKMSKKCTEIYGELGRTHPFFLSALIHKIKDSASRNESIIECLSQVPFDSWKPETEDMDVLFDWLLNTSINHFCNRLARLVLTKINWGSDREDKKLHLDVSYHRNLAVQLYSAAKMHVYVEGSEDPFNTPLFSGFDGKATLSLAKSIKPKDFIEWCWRLLLSLKLHLYEQPSFISSEMSSSPVSGFSVIPNVDIDTALLPISKGLSTRNPFAAYITLSMTERGHQTESCESNVDLLIQLMNGKNILQSLSILSWFIPLNIESVDKFLVQNSKFVTVFNSFLVSDPNDLLDRILGLIKKQFENHADIKIKILSFWADFLHEMATAVIKNWSKSWFLVSNRGLQQVVYLLDNLVELTSHDEALHTHLTDLFMKRPFDELFAKQISSSGLFSWIPFSNNNPMKKCEWISPMHVLQQKFPDKIWLSWIIIKGDMIKMDDIWHEILVELNANYELPPDAVNKNICQSHNLPPIPVALLPINAWGKLIIDTSPDHPLQPMMCFNFFKSFFSSTATEGSLGHRFLSDQMIRGLKAKMTVMADLHHKEWSASSEKPEINHHSDNTKLYRAFLLWLEETHLHDAFVDFTQLPAHFCTEMLKKVMEGAPESAVAPYVDRSASLKREEYVMKLWMEVKEYDSNVCPLLLDSSQLSVLQEDCIKPCPDGKMLVMDYFLSSPQESYVPEGSGPALSALLQHIIRGIMEEGRVFSSRLQRLKEINEHYLQLLPERYKNMSKEIVVKATCDKDKYDPGGCTGPASATFSVSEATENPQVVKELERNRIDYNKVLMELMETPSDKIVASVIHTEKFVSIFDKSNRDEDRKVLSDLLTYLLSWFQEKETVMFPPIKHVLNSFMETIRMDTLDKGSLFLLQTVIPHPVTDDFKARIN